MRNFTPDERRTFTLHLLYAAIEGVILGVLALNEFVFLKSLHGSNYMMGLLFQFSMVVFIGLVFINEWLKRVQNRKRLLRFTAIATRLPLLLLLFFPKSHLLYQESQLYHFIFLGVFLVYYSGALIINPTINFFLKNNYRHQNFGRYYSYATTVGKVVTMLVTLLYGFWLDLDHFAFIWSLPVSGVLGIISLWLLSMIHYPETKTEKAERLPAMIKKSARQMLDILRSNKAFRDFQWGFMFYGISFMVSVTVIAIYFYEGLDLNYSSVAFYRYSYNILAIMMLPFFGSLIGTLDPRKFSAITYASITFYLLFLISTVWFPQHTVVQGIKLYYVLIPYIVFHGIFAATMSLMWNIGSAYFCPPEQAGSYQSVHLFLTGFRALFAPAMGVFFYENFGLATTLAIAMLSLLIAIIVNLHSYYLQRKSSAF
jgi:hypothetical protein